jgi:LPPG:FO 2-phospho-L-lactate transferase
MDTVACPKKFVALSGGVGGAKLALGLSHLLKPDELTLIVNTADDFDHFGLRISPDLDTVMYTLAGINDMERGWGLAGETWGLMGALEQYEAESWFRLGDRDIATHLVRSQRLRAGESLSQVTAHLCRSLGVVHPVWPMSDDPVRTMVRTDRGTLPFQQYFVRERCNPRVTGFKFEGIDEARPNSIFVDLLRNPALEAIVICPSNPFVSVSPILGLRDVRNAMVGGNAPVIAVSPIVAGAAIKGPTAKMMRELNMPVSALAVAAHYGNLLSGIVIDQSDADEAEAIRALGIEVQMSRTVMNTLQDRIDLAKSVLTFAGCLQ